MVQIVPVCLDMPVGSPASSHYRSQVLSLIPAVLSFYIGSHGKDRAAWNSAMLFGGSSRTLRQALLFLIDAHARSRALPHWALVIRPRAAYPATKIPR